jgi:SsrA-binding protein
MSGIKIVAQNKKVFHKYFILENIESGIELRGTEVKSIRAGKVNLKDSWCNSDGEEIFVNNMHISAYEKGNIFNSDPLRRRKLLVHKKEISRIYSSIKRQSFSLIPISMYFKGKWIKIKIGICKGKKLYDKRATVAKRDAQRNMQRAFKENQRGTK